MLQLLPPELVRIIYDYKHDMELYDKKDKCISTFTGYRYNPKPLYPEVVYYYGLFLGFPAQHFWDCAVAQERQYYQLVNFNDHDLLTDITIHWVMKRLCIAPRSPNIICIQNIMIITDVNNAADYIAILVCFDKKKIKTDRVKLYVQVFQMLYEDECMLKTMVRSNYLTTISQSCLDK
jgi:hypothetical protein